MLHLEDEVASRSPIRSVLFPRFVPRVGIPLQMHHRFQSKGPTHSDRKPATRFTESCYTVDEVPGLKATTGVEHQDGGRWAWTWRHE